MKPDDSKIQQFLKENPDLDKQLKASVLLGSKRLVEYKQNKVLIQYEEYFKKISHPFYTDDIHLFILGDLIAGHYALNQDILVKLDLLNLSASWINAGASGSGKTNTTQIILDQILKQPDLNIRFIVFASKKGCEERSLILNNPPGAAFFLTKPI
jgi:hypothetical protein